MNRRMLYILICAIILCHKGWIEAQCTTGVWSTATIASSSTSAFAHQDLGFLSGSNILIMLTITQGLHWSLPEESRYSIAQTQFKTRKSSGSLSKKVGSKSLDQAPKDQNTVLSGIIGVAQDLLSNILAVILGSLAAYTWKRLKQLKIKKDENHDKAASKMVESHSTDTLM